MSNDITPLAKMNLGESLITQNLGKSSADDAAAMEEAAEQFEAVFVQQMFNSMWSALPNGGLLSGSNEESLYRDMFNQAISEELAKSQPLGIKDVILKEMQKNTKE
ncbi:MAG: rod-binding protein [Bdellovibrionota bacterium]|jgi:flagellar protein FlgJ